MDHDEVQRKVRLERRFLARMFRLRSMEIMENPCKTSVYGVSSVLDIEASTLQPICEGREQAAEGEPPIVRDVGEFCGWVAPVERDPAPVKQRVQGVVPIDFASLETFNVENRSLLKMVHQHVAHRYGEFFRSFHVVLLSSGYNNPRF